MANEVYKPFAQHHEDSSLKSLSLPHNQLWAKETGFTYNQIDFSREAAEALFVYESHGNKKLLKPNNGFELGKWLADLTVAFWKEDLYPDKNGQIILYPWELYQGWYPKWWLDKVIPKDRTWRTLN